jgi:hypothetical protein
MSKSKGLLLAAALVSFAVIVWAILIDNFFLMWIGWGLMFAGLEIVSLRDLRKGDTLSEQVWLGTLSKTGAWSIFWRSAIAALLIWLIFHFLLGA